MTERGISLFKADDGQDIFVQVTGHGPPLVLLHEWASSHRVWEPIAHRLADRFTVCRWDARGHGGHGSHIVPSSVRGSVSVTRMADDLACLLDHFRLERPVVVGHSMGALTLWAYIARHGCARLGKLCFIDQSPRLTTDATWPLGIYGDWPASRDQAFITAMQADFVEAVIRLVSFGLNRAARARYESRHPSLERLAAYLGMLDARPLIEVWPTLSGADFRPVLPAISVPTLLVYGEESNYYPPATGPSVRDAIAAAQLLIYASADHSPHVNQPDRFAADLAAFAGACE